MEQGKFNDAAGEARSTKSPLPHVMGWQLVPSGTAFHEECALERDFATADKLFRSCSDDPFAARRDCLRQPGVRRHCMPQDSLQVTYRRQAQELRWRIKYQNNA